MAEKGKYIYAWPRPMVAADAAVFGFFAGKAKLLLVNRRNEPFKGQWCLPGGFVDIDEELDRNQLKILKQGTVILEGRIAGWIAYRNNVASLKIFIDAELETRIGRIIKREKGDFDRRKQEIIKREKSEATRYKKFYTIDISDTSIYDLVIDSSNKKPEEIVEIILEKIKK